LKKKTDAESLCARWFTEKELEEMCHSDKLRAIDVLEIYAKSKSCALRSFDDMDADERVKAVLAQKQ